MTATESQTHIYPNECSTLTPTLGDILSDDIILRFYQCVKDVKNQQSPKQTSAMFFALCHALGDSVAFLKVPNVSKVLFHQQEQIYAVKVEETKSVDALTHYLASASTVSPLNTGISILQQATYISDQQQQQASPSNPPSSKYSSIVFSSTLSPSSYSSSPSTTIPHTSTTSTTSTTTTTTATTISTAKRPKPEKETVVKRTKKPSPRDKLYSVRRNDIIQDLVKIPEVDLLKLANSVDTEGRLVIQGREEHTKFSTLTPIHRFAALANLLAHYDCEFAPRNAGVYYNYEYFQLYLAYRDLESERQQQQESHDLRPILVQCRSEIEGVLEKTNWDTIRRRLNIGERICQMCGVIGRGFLLLSKQVSGRKLLHNFNAVEWNDFIRDFRKPENTPLLESLQFKYAPERFYPMITVKDEPIEHSDKVSS
ncbi:hypothetical protein K501DRAFT_211516 [Backusella circina FSU 941]|nr:hypothetical protein K501DRAFT_234611 [Backusella circina FSU 941]KAI8887727.1 hypothetical protein K501DRAFT_211516 [Backusella circina FSU 941]